MAKLISGKIVSVKVRNEVKKETEEHEKIMASCRGWQLFWWAMTQHLKFMFVTSSVPAKKLDFIHTNTA